VPTVQIEDAVNKFNIKKQTFLLPTGIDPDFFSHTQPELDWWRERMEKSFPVLSGKRILLFAGRVAKEKNLGFLIKLLPGLLEKYPDLILVIVGNGPDMEYFQNEAAELGVGDYCVFTGYMDRKDLALTYGISDIFVFASLTDTQGLVILEAMFSGIPVVAIGELGIIMVMDGNNGGFMVKNDSEEFSARVLDLLKDKELYRKKSEGARVHAMSWSIGEITKKLELIYSQTIEAYSAEYGVPRVPVWELLMNKHWWKINNKIIKKRTSRNKE
jgi:glycosyltransferase involved in cell wall biosynthesis